tara:strand:- start:166 stop:663 length:498 start_codon:yes stop_codon:yes gene_type:complete
MILGKQLSIIVILTAILSGCGFQLRGDIDVSEAAGRLYIDTPNYAVEDEFTVFLLDAGVTVTESADTADSVLKLQGEQYEKRTLSVDPTTGKGREFEVTYSITFSLRSVEGEILIQRQSIELHRDYLFDVDQVIGKSQEEGLLQAEMRRDAVQQILRRIESAGAQ